MTFMSSSTSLFSFDAPKNRHDGTTPVGAVYVTLDRLEDKGMVKSWLSDPTPERGGRAKRCYRLEALGERALEESAVTAKRVWDGIAAIRGKEWAKQWGKRWAIE